MYFFQLKSNAVVNGTTGYTNSMMNSMRQISSDCGYWKMMRQPAATEMMKALRLLM